MDAVITAGGIPKPDDPLYDLTRGGSKALLDVAGKPMVQWVFDALEEAQTIENVILIGLDDPGELTSSKLRATIPNQGSMLNNIRGGATKVMEINPQAEHVLLVSSDIPAITGEMVDWVNKAAVDSNADVCYNVVTRQTMEKRYPHANRTFLRLKDKEFCGADLNVLRTKLLSSHDTLWDQLIEARKSPLKQASIFGLMNVLLLFTRRLSIDNAAERVSQRLGLSAKAIECPYAEVAMDVDKPHQLEILRADLSG